MRQLNPLYLLGFSLFLLILVLFKLGESKENQHYVKEQYEKTNTLALNIVALKKSWSIGKKNKVKLEKLLRSGVLRDADISKKYKRDSVRIDAASLNYKQSQYLMNKLLNESFVIKSMKLKRLDEEVLSLRMEIML